MGGSLRCHGLLILIWVYRGDDRCEGGLARGVTGHFFSSFFSLFFISLFPVVVIKARGQDIFCSLPPRADSGSGDEGDNGRPKVRRQGGVASLISLWSFRYCRFLLSLEVF